VGQAPFGRVRGRALAERPNPARFRFKELASVAAFARDWEKFYNDHFGLRKLLIGSYRLAVYYLLRTSTNSSVVLGESDGRSRWFYYEGAMAGDGMGLDGFLGKAPYKAAELAAMTAEFARMSKLFADNHTKFLVVVCPDKQSVYPEYLPRDLRPRFGTLSRLDQISSVAQVVLGSHYLDLRAVLREAKSEGLVYLHADSHWNARGAFVGYQAFMRALQQQDPTRAPPVDSDIRWETSGSVTGDLIVLLGLPMFPGEPGVVPVRPNDHVPSGSRRGKVLVFHDSFFWAMKPYFDLEFAEVKETTRANISTHMPIT